MVQHAFVVDNPAGEDPVRIEPHQVNIYRSDQNLLWKILAQGWGWSPNHVPPIDIHDGWEGTAPAPIGGPPGSGELDRRLYSAHGPGPNMGGDEVVYNYIAWVTNDPEGLVENDFQVRGFDPVRSIPIDPEVGNQPQP